MSVKRKKYSFFYRIYRRMRYLRYVKKLRKQKARDISKQEESLNIDQKSIIREQQKSDRKAEKLKRQHDRDEAKRFKDELQAFNKDDLAENQEKYEQELKVRKEHFQKERKYRKRKRARLIRFYAKYCGRRLIRGFISLNPAYFPKHIRKAKQNKLIIGDFFVIFFQSTILFVAAYLFIFLIGLLASSISGTFYDYASKIYFYGIEWSVGSDQWYGDSVKMIYSSGPIVVVIIAVFLAILFSYIRTDRILTKLFFLWSVLHGFNAFFGALLIGSMFGKGFGYAIVWAYISDTEKVIYSIISITVLILLGILTTKSFLISANTYYSFLAKSKQRLFIWAQVGFPFIFGNALIGLVMFPQILEYDMILSLALLISIIPILVGYRTSPSLYFEEEKVKIRIKPKVMVVAIAFIVLYRIVLTIGIPMG